MGAFTDSIHHSHLKRRKRLISCTSSTKCAKLNCANLQLSENEYRANFNTSKVLKKQFEVEMCKHTYGQTFSETTPGNISDEILFCFVVISCGDPGRKAKTRSEVTNSKSVKRYTAGSKVLYWCVQGYQMEGESTLTCQDDGQWSSSAPSCKGKSSRMHPGSE